VDKFASIYNIVQSYIRIIMVTMWSRVLLGELKEAHFFLWNMIVH